MERMEQNRVHRKMEKRRILASVFIGAGPVLPGGEPYRGRWALLHLRDGNYTISRVYRIAVFLDTTGPPSTGKESRV